MEANTPQSSKVTWCRHRTSAKYFRATRTEWSSIAHELELTECARSMRLQADMSENFWAEAVSHACYLVNKSSFTVIDLQIPEEI